MARLDLAAAAKLRQEVQRVARVRRAERATQGAPPEEALGTIRAGKVESALQAQAAT